jgi:aminoglycoside phosphotransferase (APT) family kinase protein
VARPWVDLTLDQTERLCRTGRLLTRGPLNDTYVGRVRGREVFVRHRTVDDEQYGQTFVGERHAVPLLAGGLRVPAVLQVVADRTGRERFGVFEFIEGAEPRWSEPAVLDALADALVTIHRVPGQALGNLGGVLLREPVVDHLRRLLVEECDRLPLIPQTAYLRTARLPVLAAESCFEGEPVCLCHGDVHAGNVLQDRGGRLWVVDWEAARFRVAAADFNQLHADWLTGDQQDAVLGRYAERTGRDPERLRLQVQVLRFLWHVRTYNFQVLVRGADPRTQRDHLDTATAIMDGIERGLRGCPTAPDTALRLPAGPAPLEDALMEKS